MWLRWLPWRFVVSRLARSRGFVDPIALLARLHRFAQPSEVAEPIELLRAGVLFHARGLINTRAIQHNLDWVWPYWVERQFDPRDESFVARAFSATHINLTHRNWTAVGVPDCDGLPIVDPAGLVTPRYDKWSVDAWIVPDDGPPLFPSKLKGVPQRLMLDDGVAVETRAERGGLQLRSLVRAQLDEQDVLQCRMSWRARCDRPAWLAISLRPANPEGVAFIHEIESREDGRRLRVDDKVDLLLNEAPDRLRLSEYHAGDVAISLHEESERRRRVLCNVGLATAAALFRLEPGQEREVVATVPAEDTEDRKARKASPVITHDWSKALESAPRLRAPDGLFMHLFDAAVRTLALHAPGRDVYPGPYTYKRFWFRDAAFMLDALLCLNMRSRAERVIRTFPERQLGNGYFRSQTGEWDSNGEAIWTIHRMRALTGGRVGADLIESVRKGAKWIARKRLPRTGDALHAGLLPAGFSAEHLGPNDFYYWDDFWSVAGLESAAALLREAGDERSAEEALAEAKDLREAIDISLERSAKGRDRAGIPASPHRRMDAGAIGSIACAYPLRVWEARDERVLETCAFLRENCFVEGGFFQDMIHSGINAYLTLHVAQSLLRAGDPDFFSLVRTVAELASPTGQWPEAIHPRTKGGCMGDGQHVWAAAEWTLMIRNMFVREEAWGLALATGVPPEWLRAGEEVSFGPTATPWGAVTVRVISTEEGARVSWDADWREEPPKIKVGLPGVALSEADPASDAAEVTANLAGAAT